MTGAMTDLPPLRTVGRPDRRTDAGEKVSGQAVYTVDIDLPGMLHARVAAQPARPCPDRIHRRRGGARHAGGARRPDPGPRRRKSRCRSTAISSRTSRSSRPTRCATKAISSPPSPRRTKVRPTGHSPRSGSSMSCCPSSPISKAPRTRMPPNCSRKRPSASCRNTGKARRANCGRARMSATASPTRPARADAFADCDHVFEDVFHFSRMHHFHLEPFVCVADWSREDRIELWTSCQNPFPVRKEIARIFGLAENRIAVAGALYRWRLRQQKRLQDRAHRPRPVAPRRVAGALLHDSGGRLSHQHPARRDPEG